MAIMPPTATEKVWRFVTMSGGEVVWNFSWRQTILIAGNDQTLAPWDD
jgi:hypothetical protein